MVETKSGKSKKLELRDSNNPFIGQIQNHWKVVPLFSIGKLKSITNCSERELLSVYLNQGVIKFSDVKAKRTNVTSLDTSNYQRVDIGDFVLNNQQAWRGSVGVSNYNGKVSPAYIVMQLSDRMEKQYANYLFRNQCSVSQYLISSKGVGTIQRNLYFPSLKRMDVILPPKPEQTAIANFVDDKTAKIDQAIAQKGRMIELLQERKQIIIQNAVTKGLDSNIKMKDSGVEWIGKIPEHWDVRRAKYIFYESDERSLDGSEELLSVSHMTGITARSEKDVNMFRAEDYSGSKICRKGDLVYNIMWAWMGALGVSHEHGIVSPSYAVYRPLKNISFNKWYLEELLKNKNYVTHYNQVSTGLHSSRLRFYSRMFFDMEMGFPDITEQNRIEEEVKIIVDKIDASIQKSTLQIAKLKEYKTTLIDHAVTGKIKVD